MSTQALGWEAVELQVVCTLAACLLSSVVLLSLKRANPIQLHSGLTCDGLSFRSYVMALG